VAKRIQVKVHLPTPTWQREMTKKMPNKNPALQQPPLREIHRHTEGAHLPQIAKKKRPKVATTKAEISV